MRTLKVLAFIGVLAILTAIAAGTYFFGRYYSVAGNATDLGIVTWALVHIRTASIERHANDSSPLRLMIPRWCKQGLTLFRARLRKLSRRPRREVGQILRRVKS